MAGWGGGTGPGGSTGPGGRDSGPSGGNGNGGNRNGGRKRGRSGRDNYTPSQSQIDRSRAARPGQVVGGRGNAADRAVSRFESTVGRGISEGLDALGLGPRADFQASLNDRGGEGGRQALRTFGKTALTAMNPLLGAAVGLADFAYGQFTGRNKNKSGVAGALGLASMAGIGVPPGLSTLAEGVDMARDSANRARVGATANQPPAELATRSRFEGTTTRVDSQKGAVSGVQQLSSTQETSVRRAAAQEAFVSQAQQPANTSPLTTVPNLNTGRQERSRFETVSLASINPALDAQRDQAYKDSVYGTRVSGRTPGPHANEFQGTRNQAQVSLDATLAANPGLRDRIDEANRNARRGVATVSQYNNPFDATISDVGTVEGPALTGLDLNQYTDTISDVKTGVDVASLVTGGAALTSLGAKAIGGQVISRAVPSSRAARFAELDAMSAASPLGVRYAMAPPVGNPVGTRLAGAISRGKKVGGAGAGSAGAGVALDSANLSQFSVQGIRTGLAARTATTATQTPIKSAQVSQVASSGQTAARVAAPAVSAPVAVSQFETAEAAPEQGQREGQQDQRGVSPGTGNVSPGALSQLGPRSNNTPTGPSGQSSPAPVEGLSQTTPGTPGAPPTANNPYDQQRAPTSQFDEDFTSTGRRKDKTEVGPRGGRLGTDSRGNVVEILPDGTIIPINLHNTTSQSPQRAQQADTYRRKTSVALYRRLYGGGAFGIQPIRDQKRIG